MYTVIFHRFLVLSELEFHHRCGKDKAIREMVAGGYPISTIPAEMATCDVLCAYCHRKRTMTEKMLLSCVRQKPKRKEDLNTGISRLCQEILWVKCSKY